MKVPNQKYGTVVVDQLLGSLITTLKGFVPYQEIVDISQYQYHLIQQHRLKNTLVDLRLIGIYAPGVEDYINTVWFPSCRKEGIRRIAFLVPESIFGKVSMNKAHDKVDQSNDLQVAYFADQSEAREWLQQANTVLV